VFAFTSSSHLSTPIYPLPLPLQAVAVHADTTHGASTVFLKGAPDFLLPRCSSLADADAPGGTSPLDADARAAFAAALDALGRQGKRVLALCERPLPLDAYPPGYTFMSDPELNFPVEDGLILVGLLAIADPPRVSTAPAVRALREAGVAVVMVTGDAETTAEAIARQVRRAGG
jgi:magnesium-transporting ATPase (P-type)